MNSRKKSREVALQVLFQKIFSEDSTAEELFSAFQGSFDLDPKTSERAHTLTSSVLKHENEIFAILESKSKNWRVDRMATIDLIILKLAIFELCFDKDDDTPPKMCISDYVDVAKKYSSADSKKFINGILDEVWKSSEK